MKHVVVVLALVAVVTAGCGGDDEATSRPPPGGASTTANADVRAYCDKALQFETFPQPDFDPAATPAQQTEANRRYAGGLRALADEGHRLAPAQIKTDFAVVAEAVHEMSRSGDFEVFERPEVKQAEGRVHAYGLASCGWERVDVTAVDYAFRGIPPALPKGPLSFELSNTGEEPHELIVFRINEEVREPFQQLLAGGEEQAAGKVEQAGGTFAIPGGSSHDVVDAAPGRYGVACFVPVGGGEDGPPHTTRGMLAEFTVE